MSREIKFRVFDQVSKKIYPVKSIWGFPEVENVCVPFEDTVETLFHSFELMQYTGLKDTNGVYIYEGDVVVQNIQSEHLDVSDWKQVKGEVKQINGLWCLEKEHYPLFAFENEIIGNIHENPELL